MSLDANKSRIDSVGFDRRYVSDDIREVARHLSDIGARSCEEDVPRNLLDSLLGRRSVIESELHPFVIMPSHIPAEALNGLQRYVMGGFTPNGLAHLGSYLHINAMNRSTNVAHKTVSFNDLDTRTSIRKVSREAEDLAEQSFRLIAASGTRIERRTSERDIMAFFADLQKDVPMEEFRRVLGRDVTEDERMSLNIQAAAYLAPQRTNPASIVIGFDGIEEASRVRWINAVAARYQLNGMINFISLQIPSLTGGLKMGKSNPLGSIRVGDSLEEVVHKMKSAGMGRDVTFMLYFYIESLLESPVPPHTLRQSERGYELAVLDPDHVWIAEGPAFTGWLTLFNRVRMSILSDTPGEIRSPLEVLLSDMCGVDCNFKQIEALARMCAETTAQAPDGAIILPNESDMRQCLKKIAAAGHTTAPYIACERHADIDYTQLLDVMVRTLSFASRISNFPLMP